MALCPAGHQSQTADYCDVCGEAIVGAPSLPVDPAGQAPDVPAGTPTQSASGTAAAAGATSTCSNCGAAVNGRFCEECGFDSALPAPASPATSVTSTAPAAGADPAPADWSVVIRADRAWYTRAESRGGPDAGSVTFPPYFAERRFRLVGPEMMIGKRDETAGIHPAIDLRVQPEDIGISRSQAVLRQRTDGGWELVDIGSTNGTVVGDADTPIAEFTPVPLEPGDQFHIGAWTTITLVQG